MTTEAKYEELRKIEGCKTLYDLNATITDAKHIIAIADAIGVKDEHRFIDVSPTAKDIKATYMKIMKLSR